MGEREIMSSYQWSAWAAQVFGTERIQDPRFGLHRPDRSFALVADLP